MKENDFLFDSPEILVINPYTKERDLVVLSAGYNNFHFVRPIRTPRKQIYYSLHFVVSGEGILNVDGKTYRVKANDVFCLNNSSLITYYPEKDAPWEYVFFNFYGDLKDDYCDMVGFSEQCHVKPSLFPQRVISLLSTLFHKTEAGYTCNPLEMLSAFYTVLDSVNMPTYNRGDFDEKNSVEEIKYYIQLKFLSPDFTIDTLCDFMHVSHSYLCRVFKKYQHTTLIEYITSLKMGYAEELLKNSNYTVSEICYITGYECYEHFLRLFKKTHGKTPSQYRDEFQNTNS